MKKTRRNIFEQSIKKKKRKKKFVDISKRFEQIKYVYRLVSIKKHYHKFGLHLKFIDVVVKSFFFFFCQRFMALFLCLVFWLTMERQIEERNTTGQERRKDGGFWGGGGR